MLFEKKKFLSFSEKKQHKKLAEILLKKNFSHYSEILHWIGYPPLEPLTFEHLSNRYHEHLKLASISLKEANFLSQSKDREYPIQQPLGYTVYLDELRSAHNVGSIIRTTEAFAIGSLAFSKTTPKWNDKKVIKTAMGAADWVNCYEVTNYKALPRPIIALEADHHAIPVDQFTFPKECTIALGNEEYGCSSALMKQASHIVTIPMWGRKYSINVANAYSIVAAQLAKQHQGAHGLAK